MTISMLLRRVCPYCDKMNDYERMFNLHRHIQANHTKLLPARPKSAQPPKSSQTFTEQLKAANPLVPIKFMCPSCEVLFDEKKDLEPHIEETHKIFLAQEADTSNMHWIVNNLDVTKCFADFKSSIISHCDNFMDVDRHFCQHLAMSSILFIQKRHAYGNIPINVLSVQQHHQVWASLLGDFDFQQQLDPTVYPQLKAILTKYRDSLDTDIIDTRMAILAIAKGHSGPARNAILAVESLLPSLKDLDTGIINSENHLLAAYIHPVMTSLFATSGDHVAQCANIKLKSNSSEGRRPDYFVDLYERYQFQDTRCIGEVKLKHIDNILKIKDFYRLAIFAKEELDHHALSDVLCFQTIGLSTTFYLLTRKPGMLVLFELTTIVLPQVKASVLSLLQYIDEMYSLSKLFQQIHKVIPAADPYPTLPMT
ncbi:hypothetical protein DM01DRAFT_1333008 [Hesseltinella vesiculosa]|uniref:C2H2-type domain-containing protein n=1 Tax=Hesseltinella vesiculosa TaxID=101127 RepID=A0A1X2GR27_9FUNG|nr:hypothetical protein DM01DRAFT_1333008 [Hesseltinella vesiculosa]